MFLANGSLGYDSPAVSTVLAHGPVYPETEGNGYQPFQALKTKYEADTNYRPWDLEQRLRSAKLLPEDRLDPARLIQELKSIKLGFDSIRQPMSDSHLAYTFYEALPEEYRAFKMLYSQQTADIGNFEFDYISARATAFYSFQLRNRCNIRNPLRYLSGKEPREIERNTWENAKDSRF